MIQTHTIHTVNADVMDAKQIITVMDSYAKETETMAKRKSIKVAGGLADYLTTETENEHGSWNDDYKITDGFWVTHEGKKHHVYKQRRR